MTRQDFAVKLVEELKKNEIDVTTKVAGIIVKSFLDCIQDALAEGEKISLMGFGTFEPVVRKARTARSPKDGTTFQIPEKTVPKFKPASSFKKAIIEAHQK